VNKPRWFYLKVGIGNSLAEDWLAGKNPLKRPAVPIFFGRCSIADLAAGKCDKQAKHFYESSLPENREHTVITVVGRGKVWFLKAVGALEEYDPGPSEEHTWKMMPVELLIPRPFRLKDVPPVLAGMGVNAHFGRRTYTEVTGWFGNVKAIQCALGRPLPSEHLLIENCGAPQLLECLSSVELETLVAKLFEAAGCFVPAYRGGCVQYVDLFAHNDSAAPIGLGGLVVPARGRVAVQVKGWQQLDRCPGEVDCFVAFEAPKAPDCYDGTWVLTQAARFPIVLAWLKRSLHWLPGEFLSHYGAYGL
jgi:hypothetical protein